MNRRWAWISIGTVLALFSCHRQRPGSKAGPGDQVVVATIDGQPITVGELRADLGNRSSYYRLRFRSAEGQKQLLKEVLDFEVMAKEAKERGYDQAPEVVRTAKQQMINELIQGENRAVADEVSDAAVAQYYRTHLGDFTQAESVRASAIVVKDRAKADTAFGAASRLGPNDEAAFAELVTRYSEDPESRSRGGKLGPIDRSNGRFPAATVDAVFQLKQIGDISKPVQTERGFYILRLLARSPAQTRQLATVREQIAQRLSADSRTQKMDAWSEGIRSKHKVAVFEDKVAQVDLTGPGTSTAGTR